MSNEKKTNTGLVAYAKAQLGRPYWYGTLGNIASLGLWDAKAKMYPRYYSEARREKAQKRGDIGKKVHDCSGLIKGYLMSASADAPASYLKEYDLSANGFYNRARGSGAIATIPEIPGLGVWRNNHIGVYIGNGRVIEAQGFDYGVRETELKKRDFTHWLYLPFIDYSGAEDHQEKPELEKPETPAELAPVIKPNKSDEYYRVKKGDTLWAIAKKYGTTVAELQAINKLSNPDVIHVGQMILLPKDHTTPTASAPVSLAAPASSKKNTFTGRVTTKNLPLNIRAGAGTSFKIIGQLAKGSTVELLTEKTGNWYKLANAAGYVSASYISEA